MFWQNCNSDQFIILSSAFRSYYKAESIHILSGTFNPLHAGHMAIFNGINANFKFFEIAVNNKDKKLSEEQINQNILQFLEKDLPLIITKRATYQEKTDLFVSLGFCPIFHMGVDTALRFLLDEGRRGVENMSADFIVYSREDMSLDNTIFNKRLPHNMRKGIELPEEVSRLSSTLLRTLE